MSFITISETKVLSDIEKLELVFEAANEGYYYMTEDGNTRFFNQSFYKAFNIDASANNLMNWKDVVHPDDREILQSKITKQLTEGIDSMVTQYRVINNCGEIKWVEAFGKYIEAGGENPGALVGYHSDITEKKNEEEKIKRLAFHDPLTKLYNRNHVHRVLKGMIKKNEKGHLIYIDLNNFKKINTTFGYESGDHFLRIIAEHLRKVMPEEAILARNYVDEFIVILPEKTPEKLEEISNQLMESISQPYHALDKTIYPKYYICIYPLNGVDQSPNQVLHKAHVVVSYMKSKQILGVQYYNQEIENHYSRLLELEQLLPWALERNELYVEFQPIVDTQSRKINGFETLLRWKSAKLGLVGPDEFIPIAEKNDHINALGDFALMQACRFLKRLAEDQKQCTVSVNLSLVQLRQPNYIEKTLDLIEKEGIDCRKLIFEVTESVILEDSKLSEKLVALHEHGIQLAIDDFGTGFSSMNSIVMLPINYLKIDKSLVLNLLSNKSTGLIIDMLVDFSRRLNYTVVAEGVETEELRERLVELQVDRSQGYLFSRPVGIEEAYALIQEQDHTQ